MFESQPFVVEAPGDEVAVTIAAQAAARVWGLPAPVLVRLGVNGVFVAEQTVLRVSRTTADPRLAIGLARRLANEGLRVAQPVLDDVFDAGGGVSVTAWKRIEGGPPAVSDWPEVGRMIRTLHTLDPASISFPLPFCGDFPWWDFTAIIAETDYVDNQAGNALREAILSRSNWYSEARNGPLVLCHGDVHPGNVMVDANGPVLIDWDLLCLGPAAWDHAPLMTWTRRWGGQPGVYEGFAAGYGLEMDSQLARSIAELRLVAATLMRLRAARLRPDSGEAQRRLAYWRNDSHAAMWQAV